MVTFTKNNQTGNYDVIGPVNEIGVGQVVVTKKSGEKTTVTVSRVSKPFVAKFGDHKGKECCIGTVAAKSSNGYTPAVRNSRGYVEQRGHAEGYCGYDCPVTGLKCCPKNGPCHDCQ